MNIKKKLSTIKQQRANVPEFFIKEWTFLFYYQLPSVHLLSMSQAWH